VGEPFTGIKGEYVSRADTVKGFADIIAGKYDDRSEQDFYMKGALKQ
jgi:F-type H+-transporting ATPase subunit beta